MYSVSRAWESTPQEVMQLDETTVWAWSNSGRKVLSRPPTLYLLVCPSRIVSFEDLHNILIAHPPFSSDADSWAYPLKIQEVTVPLLAPTNPAQAATWSDEYWPTFYRKTNPFGAHPATIAKAETEMHDPIAGFINVDEALALAEQAADEVNRNGLGVGTGCVIVERSEEKTEIIAVAGDARFRSVNNEHGHGDCSQGNIMAHAVMRAVGMVGRKRLRVASQTVAKDAAKAEGNFAAVGLAHNVTARDAFFVDLPVNDLERKYFEQDNIKPDGYLCLKLEVFMTHEPCIMCSMALVHSRVGRVVFKHRMPQTGGLTAEKVSNDTGPVGLGYGLCWRKELNWQFMCWEYRPTTDEEDAAFEDFRTKPYPVAYDYGRGAKKGESQEKPEEEASSGPTQLDGTDERELDAVAHSTEHYHHHGEANFTSERKANPGKLSFASICV